MTRSALLSLLLTLVALLFALNLFMGSVRMAPAEIVGALSGVGDTTVRYIVLAHRLPMALTALFAGAALAVAGLLLQTALHNPLAGPSVLGISGGASLGVAVVVLGTGAMGLSLGAQQAATVAAAFAGAMGVTALLVALSRVLRDNLVLLITGLMIGYLVSSVITILNTVASAERLHTYVMWGMASFAGVRMEQMWWFGGALAALTGSAFLLVKPLNLLLLGDMQAQSLGVDLRRLRAGLLVVVGFITAVTTAMCGPVAFIGLAVPHMARMACRTDSLGRLLPATVLLGAATALLCNLIATALPSTTLPLNAVTPLVGVPVIAWVLVKKR